MNTVPDINDWNGYLDDMDSKSAFDRFFGLTNHEAQMLHAESPISSFTDLRFMPKNAFQYYILGYKDFVVSKKADDIYRGTTTDCFVKLIELKLIDNPDYIFPVWDKLIPALKLISMHQDEYGCNRDEYEDFSKKYIQLNQLMELQKLNDQ